MGKMAIRKDERGQLCILNLALFYSLLNSSICRVANSFWLKVPNVMYLTNKKCHIFNNTIYDKVIRYCQISASLMPKLNVTAQLENFMPNSKICQQCQEIVWDKFPNIPLNLCCRGLCLAFVVARLVYSPSQQSCTYYMRVASVTVLLTLYRQMSVIVIVLVHTLLFLKSCGRFALN